MTGDWPPAGAQPPATRRERRAPRQRAARDRAVSLGQHFELGEVAVSAERTPEVWARHWGCTAMLLAVLGTPALYGAVTLPSLSVVSRVILAAVVPVLLGTGIGMVRTAPRPKVSRVLAYTGGLVQDDDGRRPRWPSRGSCSTTSRTATTPTRTTTRCWTASARWASTAPSSP